MLARQTELYSLTDYQEQAEAFWQEEVTAVYRAEAGLPEEENLAEIYARYADLFSEEQLRFLLSRRGEAHGRQLSEFASTRYLRHLTLPLDDQFFGQIGPATLPWNGEELPFFATTGLLSSEADAARRRQLYHGRSQIVSRANRIRQERWQRLHHEVQRLGFANYYDFCNQLRRLQLEELAQMARAFLQETAVVYFAALQQWSQTILDTDKPDAADMFYLMRGHMFDALFPADKLHSALYSSASRLGIDLSAFAGLAVDLEARPGKSLRPFCAFVQVPTQIKLVINPMGGHQDYKAVFHELGHALHGVHISADLPFVDRYLGDETVGEAFAFLFERLPTHPVWLNSVLGQADYQTYSAYMQFLRLLFVRRCAAKLLYENEFHNGRADAETLYSSLLQTHLGLNIASSYYLLDIDDGFYNAQYFRAWMLAAQLEEWLTAVVGPEWPVSPQTAAQLRPLWQQGQPVAEATAVAVGQPSLNPQALIDSFLS